MKEQNDDEKFLILEAVLVIMLVKFTARSNLVPKQICKSVLAQTHLSFDIVIT